MLRGVRGVVVDRTTSLLGYVVLRGVRGLVVERTTSILGYGIMGVRIGECYQSIMKWGYGVLRV